ncbi:MAG: type II toxin-antitoxin system RelE/ParE family toxin [Bacteroidia bacterium]|nr:type II toxin-antitoxin system RelE/ParE family toxin [Bacteroidia bacterium]
MDTYRIDWKASALRELKRLDRKIVPRIITSVEALSSNPFPSGVKKLHGGESTFRIRIGDYRVIYEVSSNHLIVEIARIRHRKDVYKK